MKSIKIENMFSQFGNKAPNQFIIKDKNGDVYFQSYKTIIAKISKGITSLDKSYWDYSSTTGKYRNKFLAESKQETERKIKLGEYKLKNLNK